MTYDLRENKKLTTRKCVLSKKLRMTYEGLFAPRALSQEQAQQVLLILGTKTGRVKIPMVATNFLM